MIRPILPADTPALIVLAGSSGLFKPNELDEIRGMLDEYHATTSASGHSIITYDDSGVLVGIAYFAPKKFTDRVWEVLMIAVDERRQRQGIGSKMLQEVEQAVHASKGRLLLIETSDKGSFEWARMFYRKHGYTQVAQIPDYFTDGDGKASFIKRVSLL